LFSKEQARLALCLVLLSAEFLFPQGKIFNLRNNFYCYMRFNVFQTAGLHPKIFFAFVRTILFRIRVGGRGASASDVWFAASRRKLRPTILPNRPFHPVDNFFASLNGISQFSRAKKSLLFQIRHQFETLPGANRA